MKKVLMCLLLLVCTTSLVACQKNDTNEKQESNITDENKESGNEISNKILTVYFSRYGNTDYVENVDTNTSASVVVDNGEAYGTTEVVANMIQKEVGGDVYLIETEEKYTEDFDELRDVNHEEMNNNTLPKLKESDLDISKYDTIFIGYPIWATSVPQAVLSFLSEYDLSGKTVIPFCTHDGYGAGSSYDDIKNVLSDVDFLDGLAIESSNIDNASSMITQWLTELGFHQNASTEKQLSIIVNGEELEGVLYDSELAKEIESHLPLTVEMSGFGGREYYGGIDFTPENIGDGQLNFENGDITYCSQNNTMAIFYAQTDRPNLSMEVIPIGKVTSDLSIFDTLESNVEITFQLK